jgi:putative DNA primase/helicase
MNSAPQTSIADSPPEPLGVLPDGIPNELKGRPQWVNWKYAWDGKKWTKHPYNPRTGRKASSTDLLTWSTFEEVLEAYEAGRFDGLGFVLCSGDPFTGIDFDGCRNPETGQVKEWAMEIVEMVSAYAEVSPSGCGLHLIVRGVLPNSRRGGVEVYSHSRFFTMTGNVL